MAGPSHDPSLYRHRDLVPIRRALVSVSDKTDLLRLAEALSGAGVEIVSTGSTAATIRNAGFTVTDVASVTGFPESLGGRVKTLHPGVHAGLLADLRLEDHVQQLAELGIEPFELVVVNLYPFVETVRSGAQGDDVVEQIDIGGPAMVRASAKNFSNVAIVVSPESYPAIIEALGEGGTTLAQRKDLAARAFAHTCEYDRAVATWFAEETLAADDLPRHLTIKAERLETLRYGENSHQRAAIYTRLGGHGIAQATQVQGKEMSSNNYFDADAALRAAFDMVKPAVAIIKHANPCGIAVAAPNALDPIASAHLRAHECDPVSAFGGVIAANRTITLKMAENLRDIFTEVIVAPDFEPEALEVFKLKKNLRVLKLPVDWQQERMDVRLVSGGLLLQDADRFPDDIESVARDWQLVSGERPAEEEMTNLIFAWKAAYDFDEPCVAIIKHANPCGIAVGSDIADAHRKANDCDPVSAYGGVVATNRPVSMQLADQLGPIFTEVVVAPGYEDGVLERWAKKKDLRVLVASARPSEPSVETRPVSGGLLVQSADRIDAPGDDPSTWTLACGSALPDEAFADLVFAWRALRAVKSNAILLARGGATVGVGMGQVNRVDSCRLAVARAGDRVDGAVAASDAYFPFADGAQVLLDAGIKAIVQPGGSIRDADVIEAVQAAGATMYLTGTRHFAH
jgi:phosphoribosylaminoimidazolecarboxamide formyltransferase/IMP cyclohydrolase